MLKIGDTAYIILNNMIITEVIIKRFNGNLCVVRFINGGGIQVPKNRLFETPEQADKYLNKRFGRASVQSEELKQAKQEQSVADDSLKYNAQLL